MKSLMDFVSLVYIYIYLGLPIITTKNIFLLQISIICLNEVLKYIENGTFILESSQCFIVEGISRFYYLQQSYLIRIMSVFNSVLLLFSYFVSTRVILKVSTVLKFRSGGDAFGIPRLSTIA